MNPSPAVTLIAKPHHSWERGVSENTNGAPYRN